MSNITKYSRRRIAALCGAAILFVGEMRPAIALAEQTEQDMAGSTPMSLEAPAKEMVPESSSLLTESVGTGESTELTEVPLLEPDPVTGEAPAGTLAGPENPGETVPETELPEGPSGNGTEPSPPSVEGETGVIDKPAEGETGMIDRPTDSETGQMTQSETVPAQSETQTPPEKSNGESETAQTGTESGQTETSPGTEQTSEVVSTEDLDKREQLQRMH